MGILDAPGYSRAQANSRFAARNTLGVLGDSFQARNQTTSGTIGTNGSFMLYDAAKGFLPWALAFLGGRLRLVSNVAVAGKRSDQFIADGQVASMIATAPAWCIVGAPTNDREQLIAVATTQGYMTTVIDSLLAAGIKVVALGLTPRSAMTTAQQGFTVTYNQWLKSLTWTRPNLHVIDPYNALASGDPTGTWISTATQQWTEEGLHPLNWSCARMGRLIADTLDPLIPYVDARPNVGIDRAASGAASANLVLNGGLTPGTAGVLANGGTGTVVSNFSLESYDGAAFAGGVAASIVAATDQTGGPWQQAAITTTASKVRFKGSLAVTTGFTAGTTKIRPEVEIDMDADTSVGTLTGKLAVGAQVTLSTGGFFESRWDYTPAAGGYPSENRLTKDTRGRYPVLVGPTVLLPSAATAVRWYIDYWGLGTFRWRSPVLRTDPIF